MFWGIALETWPWQPAWAGYLDTAPAARLVGRGCAYFCVPQPSANSYSTWLGNGGQSRGKYRSPCLFTRYTEEKRLRTRHHHLRSYRSRHWLKGRSNKEAGHWSSLFHYLMCRLSSACWVESPLQVWGKPASFSDAIGATVENFYSYIQKSYLLVLRIPPQSFLFQNLKLRQTPS